MSEWNCSTPEERISRWKSFREEISALEDADLLNKTAQFFASVPVETRYIDYYTPSSWPTPWEILYDKLFCRNSVSLLIYDTLCLTLGKDRVELILIDDDRDRFLVPLVDKKCLLNYLLGEVNSIEDFPQIQVVESFRNDEIRSLA